MSVVGVGVCEGGGANGTPVRAAPRVVVEVLLEVLEASEALGADGAEEGTLVGVLETVALQLTCNNGNLIMYAVSTQSLHKHKRELCSM